MSGPVSRTVSDGVATVTIDRPEAKNAMSAAVADGIKTAMAEVAADERVRCVVVTGTGGAFCAGGDIDRMQEKVEERATGTSVEEHARELRETVSAAVESVVTCDLPTVARIDGPAVGAGATLAIACDLQVASASSVIGFVFRQVGLSIDSGASYFLPRLVGTNTAKRLVYSGELVGAERALDLGLFTHVFADDAFEEEAAQVIEEIATGPTVALRHAKRLIDEGVTRSYSGAVDAEATAQGLVYGTDDHAEGVTAFLEKRRPEFDGQ